jgi:hypothetical protein
MASDHRCKHRFNSDDSSLSPLDLTVADVAYDLKELRGCGTSYLCSGIA